jgi:hypothetical protein
MEPEGDGKYCWYGVGVLGVLAEALAALFA